MHLKRVLDNGRKKDGKVNQLHNGREKNGKVNQLHNGRKKNGKVNQLHNGRKKNVKVNQLHSIISNRDINLSARRLLLLSVIRPSIEYGSEVWESNKGLTNALESVVWGEPKKILGCSSKTCNKAVRRDIGLDMLKSRRDKAKLKIVVQISNNASG